MGEIRIFKGTAIIHTTNVREEPQETTFTLTATQRPNGTWDLAVDHEGTITQYRECHFSDSRRQWEGQALRHIEDCFHCQVMAILDIKGNWQQ